MTTNRLAKSDGARVSKLSAADYAAIARENGDFEKAKLWDREAAERGEERIPNGITVSFDKVGNVIRIPVRPR